MKSAYLTRTRPLALPLRLFEQGSVHFIQIF